MSFYDKIESLVYSKILCHLNKHYYVNDNGGMGDFTLHGMNYYHCRYCPKFKLEHPMPVPISYIQLALKQKILFERELNKRDVLLEKFDFNPRNTALRKLKKLWRQ